jgi:hypothetical protein
VRGDEKLIQVIVGKPQGKGLLERYVPGVQSAG